MLTGSPVWLVGTPSRTLCPFGTSPVILHAFFTCWHSKVIQAPSLLFLPKFWSPPFLQGALVPLMENEWCLETRIWELGRKYTPHPNTSMCIYTSHSSAHHVFLPFLALSTFVAPFFHTRNPAAVYLFLVSEVTREYHEYQPSH